VKRYGADYSGLKRKEKANIIEKKQAAPGKEVEEEIQEKSDKTKEEKSIEEAVHKRLRNLGY